MHAGGAPLPAGDARRATIVAWVAGLAAPPPAAAPVPAPRGAGHGGCRDKRQRRAAPAPRRQPGPPAGSGCRFGFLLNGRFDLNYERRQFSGDPFGATSVAALRSYHHFLFLSRDARRPLRAQRRGAHAAVLGAHCRLPGGRGPCR